MSNNTSTGYAVFKPDQPLGPHSYQLKPVGDNDVVIKVQYCGICHSDLHQARDEWGGATYPMVPGHEICGVIEQTGKNVTKFKTGQLVGLGCYVQACGTCNECKRGAGNYCKKVVFTYNSQFPDGTPAFGGYCDRVLVHEDYVNTIPEGMDPAEAAPLLCAGVTVYSPIKHYGVKAGDKVGIVGFGGLGHMAAKIAKSMGAEVTIFSTSASKEESAKKLGCDFVVSKDTEKMKSLGTKFNKVISTIAAKFDLNPFIDLLDVDGNLILLGIFTEPLNIDIRPLVFRRIAVGGSLIGSVGEVQEMLEYCAKHKIAPVIEKMPVSNVNEGLKKLEDGSMSHRIVLVHPGNQ